MMSNITLSSTVRIDSFNDLFYKDYAVLDNEFKFIPKELEATVDSTARKQLITECSQHYARALQSTEQYFPTDSIHVKTLKSKLQKIQEIAL